MLRYLSVLSIILFFASCKTTNNSAGSLFTLSGNNPFWTAEITKSGIIFEELGVGKVTYPFRESENSGDLTIFLTSKMINGEKNWLKITLVETPCQDYLAGSKRLPYKAEVEKDGKIYYGCGRK
ncbi:MAG: hypothetical protein MRY78_08770 [Saprospiraceae bacterium]|nr:hypothetical protein [Saprospiraceae bacterium]